MEIGISLLQIVEIICISRGVALLVQNSFYWNYYKVVWYESCVNVSYDGVGRHANSAQYVTRVRAAIYQSVCNW